MQPVCRRSKLGIHVCNDIRLSLVLQSGIMTIHTDMLPDCISVHNAHLIMYKSTWVEGVQLVSLLCTHENTTPGLWLVQSCCPLKIQYTSWNLDVPVHAIWLSVWPKPLNIDSWYFAHFVNNFVKSKRPEGNDSDQAPHISESKHCGANILPRLQQETGQNKLLCLIVQSNRTQFYREQEVRIRL